MKKFFLFCILIFCSINIFSQEFESGKLIVKFKEDSSIPDKLMSGELTQIEEFRQIIGEHTIKTYINPALLNNLYKRKNNDKLLNTKKDIGLERIFEIEYSGKINADIAASKLKTFNFAEYAEPKFIHKIVDEEIPNDSLYYSQYYLHTAGVLDSWSHVDTTGKKVIIGVVDTGIDYLHEDLAGKMHINPGEDGLDNNGNDKRTNLIDDDENGFTDDFMGWDFGATSSPTGFDNDPIYGNPHGTHVSGIITAIKNNFKGIAGIGLNTEILPVKIGYDSQFSRNLVNSYDGLLYAAMAGAEIINCSWGSGGYSQAEQDVVHEVSSLGALIVAAAGNDGELTAFYPAAYEDVISVAAIDSLDFKAAFSNYHSTVDIAAPGVLVMSSIPMNMYEAYNGTSMASPVVAAVAGMVRLNHPEYNNIQIGEHLKATAENISETNKAYSGLIGTGKVNAYKAVTEANPIALSVKKFEIIQEIEDDVIKQGERIDIKLVVFNAIRPVKDVLIHAASDAYYKPVFINESLSAGNFGTLETKVIDGTISFRIPDNVPMNYLMPISIYIIEGDGKVFTTTVSFYVNPTWRTMRSNNIHLTLTSQGNLAYDDFSKNSRGSGFTYKGGSNILFEGALMVGFGSNSIPNAARGASASYKDDDFVIVKTIETAKPGQIADEETHTEYKSREDSLIEPVRIIQHGYQSAGTGKENCILVTYDIINESGVFQDSVYAAIYMDWDIGSSGSNNRVIWNKTGNYGYVINTADDTLPKAAVKMFSKHNVNFWAMDNNGNTEDNPGVYDGFTKTEKWKTMTSGIGRDSSDTTDVSMIIGAGPVSLRTGDTTRITFAFYAGYSVESIENSIKESAAFVGQIMPDGKYSSQPVKSLINLIFPNPAQNSATVELAVSDINTGELSIWDINGKRLKNLYKYNSGAADKLYPGFIRLNIDLKEFSTGQYFLRFKTDKEESSQIINIMR